MTKDSLHEPFEVIFERVDKSPMEEQVLNFFRLVYIASGNGKQYVNKNETEYSEGNLFLLTPDDYYWFDVRSTTEFLLINFNTIYIQNNGFDPSSMQRMEFILQNANHNPGCIIHHKLDKLLVKTIADTIIREHCHQYFYSEHLVRQLINTLIMIVTRNIAINLPELISENTDEKAMNILQYIQTNIADPPKIRLSQISKYFGVSESYIGRYFKKQTNETMQHYISNYRVKMVENRLIHSDMRIAEIAFELGFADESHLHKFFKKKNGISPSEYRKRQSLFNFN